MDELDIVIQDIVGYARHNGSSITAQGFAQFLKYLDIHNRRQFEKHFAPYSVALREYARTKEDSSLQGSGATISPREIPQHNSPNPIAHLYRPVEREIGILVKTQEEKKS